MSETRKKRLLFNTEFSALNTGYSTYSHALLSYLHNTGKYDVAELSSFCQHGDPRISSIPWKVYPVMPRQDNQNEMQFYHSDPINQFGKWKFEETCLDFQADCVFDIRDPWMIQYESISPFRNYYKWAICPAIDAENQSEDWLYDYSAADCVFTYTDWGVDVLRREGKGQIKVRDAAPACVDLDVFKPVQNKQEHKRKFGFRDDILIFGTVQRNQKRKLYPDLFQSFKTFLETAPRDLANKTFLYVHASYPDLGWDFPRLIKKLGLSSKVLFTYMCTSCGLVAPRFYQDVRSACPKCNSQNFTFPNTQVGLDRNALSQVYNLFDVYVQYSSLEAQGVPIVEAAACGVPVMVVDYSGMADVCKKVKGTLLKVQRYNTECETGRKWAFPDNDYFVNQLINFLQLPESLRLKKGFEARKLAERHYNWKSTCEKWEKYFDEFELRPLEQTWHSPPRLFSPSNEVPNAAQLNDEMFVNWAIANVWGRPEYINSYHSLRILRDLTWGCQPKSPGGMFFGDLTFLGDKPAYDNYTRERVCEQLKSLAEFNNHWEQLRWTKAVQNGSR